jgi:hypothetical protein
MHAVLPDPFYYLANFQRVLDWIAQRYADLLSPDEISFIEGFPALPQTSRALLVRMVMRKGTLFRAAKLRYPEIGCPDAAAQALVEQGWIAHDPLLTLEELFGLLRKAEIVQAFRINAQAGQRRKPDLLAALREEFMDARPLAQWHAEAEESVYRLQIAELCERLRLMFFGNLHQDWSEFVLSDLGVYRYEQVEFSPESRGFQTRQDIDDFLHLHRCRERFDQGELLDTIVLDIPLVPHTNPWLENRRNKLLFRIAREYERCAEWQEALTLYRRCAYPGARLRAIRVLERDAQFAAAMELAEIATQVPESEAELQGLLRMLPRLRRALGHAKPEAVKRQTHTRIDLLLPFPDTPLAVELAAGAHLASADAPVLYVENTLINSLFGLLCWPAIFAAVPGAFFHPFHHGPADLHSADFLPRRADIFASCLAQLNDAHYRASIVEYFHLKHGIQSPFVSWQMLDIELLTLALDCIPAAHLKKYFERILADIAANRSGLPDLVQFWPREKRYRMLEVKGPGDRLQDNQVRWLNYCAAHDMPVAVCHVQWEAAA